ncbi:hypothetical protein OpiT1DRAFT_00436 [Opitutaceae bacterium TAV1]|nr:hypothetical protein OpiT1DRAFT_00436 [Opitutaceae bacterium TAV1]
MRTGTSWQRQYGGRRPAERRAGRPLNRGQRPEDRRQAPTADCLVSGFWPLASFPSGRDARATFRTRAGSPCHAIRRLRRPRAGCPCHDGTRAGSPCHFFCQSGRMPMPRLRATPPAPGDRQQPHQRRAGHGHPAAARIRLGQRPPERRLAGPTARSAAHPAIHNPFPRDDPRDRRACASQPEISHINGKRVAKKAPA